MKNINSKDLHTERLDLKVPTMKEQKRLWEILINEDINQYYFPTPNRVFRKNNLNPENIKDAIKARKIFMEELSDWERQKPFYERKIEQIHEGEDNQKFTWSIFLKDSDTVIGQVTCQPKDDMPSNIRDVGWFMDLNYQGKGYTLEAAGAMLDFMFNEVEITDIYTSAVDINPGSWGIMEAYGFVYTGEKKSSYIKDGKFLTSKEYHINKELFLDHKKETKRI